MRFISLFLTVLASFSITSSSAEGHGDHGADMYTLPSIADLVIATPSLSNLLVALKAQGEYVEPLSNCESGPFTVFAPKNGAIKRSGAIEVIETLEAPGSTSEEKEAITKYLGHVLGFHVLEGVVESSEIKNGDKVTTLVGDEILTRVTKNGGVWIEPAVRYHGAKVIMADIEACNGVVHVIDSLLMPPHGKSSEMSSDYDYGYGYGKYSGTDYDYGKSSKMSSDDGNMPEMSSDDGNTPEMSSDDGNTPEMSSDDGNTGAPEQVKVDDD